MMFKCEICGREFESVMSLPRHISTGHKIKIEEYYLKYINSEKGKCVECGKDTSFINLRNGYLKYCSCKCSANSIETKNKLKESCMKNFGSEYPLQNKIVKNKKKETCKKNFGCEHPMQNIEVKNKSKETCKKNFGCDYPMQNIEVRNKHKETCIEKFGCENPSQFNEFKEKKKETYIEKFGCENPSQFNEFKEKKKETCKKNFGCESPMQNNEVKIRKKETCNKKYGCESPMQNNEVKNKSKNTCNKKYGCDYPMQNKIISEKSGESNKLSFQKVEERYPYLVKIEGLISGPNGEILGHCKNSNCKNSKENGGYFELSTQQIYYRNLGINSVKDGNYFYCCEECKQECPLFGKNANQLHNLANDDPEILYTSEEYSTWKTEILLRQLKDNLNHSSNFCEICHSIENLQVHHIQPQKLEPGYALDPPNGMILCQKCHLKHGHEKGTECSTGNLANKSCK